MINKNDSAPIIIIFGITGDLSKRKLLPALYHLLKEEDLPEDASIIGTSRKTLNAEDLLSTVELCVLEKDKVCDPDGLAKVKKSLQTLQLDPEDKEGYKHLHELIEKLDPDHKRSLMFYMSVPSSAYEPIVKNLAEQGLNSQRSRLLLEKPFGHDLISAEKLIKQINQAFKEEQLYRIDHYLAKETAQNLLAFRLHNPIFTPLWNSEHIQSIRVRAFETIDIEGRVNFYEQTGALRDIIQSHLMQLLSITMMPLPESMDSQAIHKSKQEFFDKLNPADPNQATRGQYESYKKEVGNDSSNIETYARVELNHQSDTWADTEIVLETGKAMKEKTTDITLEFKTPHERRRNSITFQIQPNEGINLDLVVKEPGLDNRMRHADMNFSYKNTFSAYKYVDAYERVLMDAIRGDQSLFASDLEVLATWRVLQPIIDDWAASNEGIRIYATGSKEDEII
jgi:glucose-6-phosphate 1-dehydrogenase